jgi:tetratricopeptide (TPR) repeat protein
MELANQLSPENPGAAANLIFHYLVRSDFDQARTWIAKLRAFAPKEIVQEVEGKAQLIWGDAQASLKTFQAMLGSSISGSRHRGALLAACNLAETGHLDQAAKLLEGMLPDDESQGDWQWRAQKLVVLAELALFQDHKADAIRLARQAAALDNGDLVQERAGVVLARCQALTDAAQALKILQDLPALPRTVRRATRLKGEIGLQSKTPADGLKLIQRAAAATNTWDLNDSLAHALESSGADEAALAERIALASSKGFLWTVAERIPSGTWSMNVSALTSLAHKMGRLEEERAWQKQLNNARK